MLFNPPAQGDCNVDNAPASQGPRDVELARVRLGPSKLLPFLPAVMRGPDVGVRSCVEFLAVRRTGDGKHAAGHRVANVTGIGVKPGGTDVDDVHVVPPGADEYNCKTIGRAFSGALYRRKKLPNVRWFTRRCCCVGSRHMLCLVTSAKLQRLQSSTFRKNEDPRLSSSAKAATRSQLSIESLFHNV
ncbi:hypothetical protein GALL_535730 [mine drainage metagenome]|uniref:Uncharacterized protein n=1 Tax=mine drainage metagenome TaxID=410659 RepID=A0A1J5PHX3_9ZZZZ